MKRLNKKGFTLVELLAVIVVLALVMLIATRAVLDQVKTAKGKSAIVQGEALRREINNACIINDDSITENRIKTLIKADKIFGEAYKDIDSVSFETETAGIIISLADTDFDNVIAPSQTGDEIVKILKSAGGLASDEEVEDGRLYIRLDCMPE